MSRPYLIGLTGNIACGKSTVLRELRRLGAAVLDADAVAHDVMRAGTPVHRAIVEAFGDSILAASGEIDRRALGKIVFSDPEALARLEAIVHPAVLQEARQWLEGVKARVAVIDAIKLFESGIADWCDEVWVVTCPEEEQLRRLVECRGLSPEEASTRIRAQPPQAEKVARADRVIENSGSLDDVRACVRAAWRGLRKQGRMRKAQREIAERLKGDA
ncbi:MAG: dephospho-CoA kinase [Chloroflexia bacterium]